MLDLAFWQMNDVDRTRMGTPFRRTFRSSPQSVVKKEARGVFGGRVTEVQEEGGALPEAMCSK